MAGIKKAEVLCQGRESTEATWKAGLDGFDLAAVFPAHPPRVVDVIDVFHAMGAKTLQRDLMGLQIEREDFYLDGPGWDYWLELKGERLVESDVSRTRLRANETV